MERYVARAMRNVWLAVLSNVECTSKRGFGSVRYIEVLECQYNINFALCKIGSSNKSL